MGLKDRLLQYIDFKGLNKSKFERTVGLSNGFVDKSGDNTSVEKLEQISNSYPDLNIAWLRTGMGSMLVNTERSGNLNTDTTINDYRLVPLINIDAVGGMYSENEVMNEPEYVIGTIAFNGALEGDKCIQVTGHSMEPACPPGSIVLIRQVERWKEYFGFGNIFVVLLEDGRRVLKQITKSDEDPCNYVKCVSFNRDYPEEDLPKSMIAGVWKVIKVLTDRGW